MNSSSFGKLFPLGSHLCREPMPAMSELKKDMETLKQHGFNLIKLQEQWAFDEPLEGQYDFSKYEELIAHAQKLDLGVYLGLTLEQAPGWLWEKHPDCRMVGRNGLPIAHQAQSCLPSDGKPGPCFDHPGAAADMVRFIQKIVQVLGRFENLVVWNTWQEIGYWGENLVGQPVCYCPNTISHYQNWLKSVFGDLDQLNRAWKARYPDWHCALPDRFDRKNALVQNLYWNYFMANVQPGEILKLRAKTIKDADPLHRPVFAHKSAMQLASGMDWTYARCQDFLGSSTYPTTSGAAGDRHACLLSEMYNAVVLRFDYLRSCNPPGKPVWAAEFQGGPVSGGFHKGRMPMGEDIERWMLAGIGSGLTGISFWVTRAEIMAGEANGYGLLDSEGDTTERFEATARVGKALNRHAELFTNPSHSLPEVGILINEHAYQYCQTANNVAEHLQRSVTGWHRILWEANIPAGFIDTRELGENNGPKPKVLILPFPLCLSEETAKSLVRYVENGGTLISEAAPGRIDNNCFCTRGELSPTMRDLFGVDQESFLTVREPDGGRVWTGEGRWGEYLEAVMLKGEGILAGLQARANVCIETFRAGKAEPVLMYGGSVAGVRRRVGKGTAWLIGTYLGHNGNHYQDDETRRTICALLEQSGVKPIYTGKLLLRKRIGTDKEAWIFTNPTAKDITESVNVAGWNRIEDLLEGKLPITGNTLNLTVKSLEVKALILSR